MLKQSTVAQGRVRTETHHGTIRQTSGKDLQAAQTECNNPATKSHCNSKPEKDVSCVSSIDSLRSAPSPTTLHG
ncbi:hypothetical protein ILYODFUR_002114 [Ilyodon furcidens]|uniref:Uncharacterized protein n=1 Tax=Ilyodon furcidens TaxID=33524 RepID=A0ABV0SVA7_9TELE